MTGLRDTVVVVTGAAKGTGRVHCQRFADEGADVIALDAPAVADELADTAEKVADRGRRCVTGLADVTDSGPSPPPSMPAPPSWAASTPSSPTPASTCRARRRGN